VRFRELPVAAQVYIAVVTIGGAVLLCVSTPRGGVGRPLLLLSFIAASSAVHTIKMSLPVGPSSSFSMGMAVSFASMLVLGPAATAWVTMAGAWAQCTFNVKVPIPWYRTAFTMSAWSLSMESAAQVLKWTGGSTLTAPADVVIPAIVTAAFVYFLVNTILMAMALGLTNRTSIIRLWDQEFLWTAPNYFVSALASTVAVQSVTRYGLEAVVLLLAPVVLTYRVFKMYVGRFDDITRKNQELNTLYQRAHAESLTDPLTELPNRRFLVSHALSELARASRERYDVAFVIVDVDNFKSINDVYGHQQGDEALRKVAQCLRRGLRPYDVCGRFGGDEFILVLSRCNAALAEKRASELALAVAAASSDAGEVGPPLSISVGTAIYPADGRTYEKLLAAADARMYKQKHARPPFIAAARAMPRR